MACQPIQPLATTREESAAAGVPEARLLPRVQTQACRE